MITLDDLKAICPKTPPDRLAALVDSLNDCMAEFEINTVSRETCFLAQVAHESGGFRFLKELWGPTPQQERYEGRKDLGNTTVGDGFKYRGRGLIQVTGRANYRACGEALMLDLEAEPELLEQPENACRSAGWFWKSHGCNELADAGDFVKLTRRINGGTNGLADRIAYLDRATAVIG